MPTPVLMPSPRQRFFDNIGLPLVRGYVFTFAAGTSTKMPAYQDAAGLIPHENPIRLDDRGEATIYWLGNYKVDLRTAGPFSTQVPGYPVDNFNAVDATTAADSSIAALVASFLGSSGSTLVNFLQDGVGAVKRTVQSKLRDVVDARDFGAKFDGVTDDADAIIAAKTYAESAKKTLRISGFTVCSKDIILNPGTSIHGDGMATTQIKFTGTAAMKSARTVCDYVDIRDFWIQQGGTGLIGLDIGTLRRSVVQNIRVWEYLIGVNLDIGVPSTANYWNRLINCEAAGPGKTLANSVGFNLGNNVNATYPDNDYTVMIGCKSFTCQTGVRVLNAIGCQITGHQCTEVTTGLQFFNGNNCNIEMMVENSTNMGFADVNTRANKFYMYNDGGNATAFADNGWNYVEGQLLEYPTLSGPSHRTDSFTEDRIFFGGVALTKPFFQLDMTGASGALAVTVTYGGDIAGNLEIAGVAVWDVLKVPSGSAPVANLRSITGASYATASFAGTVMTTASGQIAVGQVITAAGVPVGTTITSFTSGGGAAGTVANISNNVGTLGVRPINGADPIFSVSATSGGLVTWTANGHATAQLRLNAVVSVQGINSLNAYPWSRIAKYTRLV